jgi:hypothetical protein
MHHFSMQWLTKYYGVDWAVFVLIVIHLWLLGHRKRSAFIAGMVGTSFGFLFGIMVGSVASVIMNVVFCAMHIRAYMMWHEPPPPTILVMNEVDWEEDAE